MTAATKIVLISVEDYLAGELKSKARHEYVGGYVHAIAGGKNVHSLIATNFTTSLGSRLRGKPCMAFNSDTKLRIQMPTHTRFYYPDGMVGCEPTPPDNTFQDKPVVVAEVLSGTTRRTDHLEKRDAYITIPSLAVYLLIETQKAEVTAYRRGDQGFESEVHIGFEAVVPLPEVECQLPLAELYERVEFKPAG